MLAQDDVIEFSSSSDEWNKDIRAIDDNAASDTQTGLRSSAKERQQRRALKRMMPAIMIKQSEKAQRDQDDTRSRTSRQAISSSNSSIGRDHSAEEQRSHLHIRPKLSPLVIRGDPESPEPASAPVSPAISSPTQSSILEDNQTTDESDGDYVNNWLAYNKSYTKNEDLIDRMLSHTRNRNRVRHDRQRILKNTSHSQHNPGNGYIHVYQSSYISNPIQNVTPRLKQARLPFLPAPDAAGHKPSFRPSTRKIPSKKTSSHNKTTQIRRVAVPHHQEVIRIEDDDEVYDALAPHGDVHQKTFQPPIQGPSMTPETLAENSIAETTLKTLTVDFGIPSLQNGPNTLSSVYLQGTRLQQLLELRNESMVEAPWTYDHFDIDLVHCKQPARLEAQFPTLCDRLFDWATGVIDTPDAEVKALQMIVSASQLVSWILQQESNVSDIGTHLVSTVHSSVFHLVDRATEWVSQHQALDRSLRHRTIWLYWMSFEMALRISLRSGQDHTSHDRCSPLESIETSEMLDRIVIRLFDIGLHETIAPLKTDENKGPHSPIKSYPIEAWVCIIYVTRVYSHEGAAESEFWRRVERGLLHQTAPPDSDLERGERVWRAIFSLSALSQFSTMGSVMPTPCLQAYWALPCGALACIRLTADEKLDNSLSNAAIGKRDAVIRRVLARCFILTTRWRWNLSNGQEIFRMLCDIFRTRGFTNLAREASNFPLFITDMVNNPQAHSHHMNHVDSDDTAFDLLLKLLLRASNDLSQNQNEEHRSKQIRKLLSMAVPVGSAQFTPKDPPLGRELSMLYNRYSSCLVAITLLPTSLQPRITQAQRYSDFVQADWQSRKASIRAMMYFAIWIVAHEMQLDVILPWLSSISSCLLSELNVLDSTIARDRRDPRAGLARSQVIIAIQLLFGSLRLVLESQSTAKTPGYPDPVLLQPGKCSWSVESGDTNPNCITRVVISSVPNLIDT